MKECNQLIQIHMEQLTTYYIKKKKSNENFNKTIQKRLTFMILQEK